MPGAYSTMLTVCAALDVPLLVTATVPEPPIGASKGTWKLICAGETNSSGAALPSTRTCDPPNVAGSGSPLACAVPLERLEPKIVASVPGVSLGAKLAPFTTPPGLMTGDCEAATPLPLSVTVMVGCTGSLLLMVSVPFTTPVAAGWKRTVTDWSDSGATVKGSAGSITVNAAAELDADLTESGALPPFEMLNVRSS